MLEKLHIIKEPYASEIKKKLIRFKNKQFNEEEIKQFERKNQILKEYDVIE